MSDASPWAVGAVQPAGVSRPAAAGASGTRVSGVDQVGYRLVLAFLFVLTSRAVDFIPLPLHATAILGGGSLILALFSARLLRAVSHPISFVLLGYTTWLVLSVPFSVWKGGSANTVIGWLKSLLVFLAITAFITTERQLRTAVAVIAASVFVLAILSLVFGTTVAGRLAVPGGKFGNSNDLAHILIIALPMWWFLASRPQLVPPAKVAVLLFTVPMLVAFLKTGSRAGMLGFGALMVGIFLMGSPRRKALLALSGILVLLGAVMFVPGVIRDRYTTFFQAAEPADAEDPEAEYLEGAAISSAYARWALLKDSILLTKRHPLIGVGAGQFMVAQRDLAKERGELGAWRVTHNSFTQVSSEAGIPALVLWTGALVYCFRCLRKPKAGSPPEPQETKSLREYLTLSLLAFAVSSFFLSVAYDFQFPMLAGLAVVFARCAQGARQPAPARPSGLRRGSAAAAP